MPANKQQGDTVLTTHFTVGDVSMLIHKAECLRCKVSGCMHSIVFERRLHAIRVLCTTAESWLSDPHLSIPSLIQNDVWKLF